MLSNNDINKENKFALRQQIANRVVVPFLAATFTPVIIFVICVVFLILASIVGDISSFQFKEMSIWHFIFILIWGAFWISFLAMFVLLFSFGHVLIFGIPAFIIGVFFNKIHWWSALIVGFMIGAIPTIFAFWPGRSWEYAFPLAMVMGFFGLSGGFAFWLAWQFLPHNTIQVANNLQSKETA